HRRRHDATIHLLSRLQEYVRVPDRGGDYGAGGNGGAPRLENRVPASLLERPGSRVQEDRQHHDGLGRLALEIGSARTRPVADFSSTATSDRAAPASLAA